MFVVVRFHYKFDVQLTSCLSFSTELGNRDNEEAKNFNLGEIVVSLPYFDAVHSDGLR